MSWTAEAEPHWTGSASGSGRVLVPGLGFLLGKQFLVLFAAEFCSGSDQPLTFSSGSFWLNLETAGFWWWDPVLENFLFNEPCRYMQKVWTLTRPLCCLDPGSILTVGFQKVLVYREGSAEPATARLVLLCCSSARWSVLEAQIVWVQNPPGSVPWNRIRRSKIVLQAPASTFPGPAAGKQQIINLEEFNPGSIMMILINLEKVFCS